jgi:hypothetical protein
MTCVVGMSNLSCLHPNAVRGVLLLRIKKAKPEGFAFFVNAA